MAADTPGAGPAPARGGIAGALSAKMGPWPTWAWLLVITVAGLGFYLYEKHKKGAAPATPATAAAQAAPGQVTGAQNVPDYVSQVSVYNQEPAEAAAPAAPPVPVQPGGPPKPAPTGVTRYPAPTGVTVSKLSASSALVKFRNVSTPTPAPTSYTIAAFDKGGHLAAQETVNPDEKGGLTQATLQGLKRGAYTIRVWANGGKVAPPGTNVSVTL